jgi:hypothetical protein
LQTVHLTRNLGPAYVKNCYNSIIKRQSDLKMGPRLADMSPKSIIST